ncbi:MAG: amidohydrolase family protein [Planctomycetota bacterium]|nr:amidohydrolase family protein [Planctomycetota bacterium]
MRSRGGRAWLAGAAAMVVAVAASSGSARAQESPVAFVGATILPVAKGGGPAAPIAEGVMVVHRGRIEAIGDRSTLIPPDARRIDARGKFIIPGLVDTHSHIGGVGAADESGPIQPGARVSDSVNVRDSGFRRAVAGGMTTLNIMPGSGHLLSGQTVYVKLRSPRNPQNVIRPVAGAQPELDAGQAATVLPPQSLEEWLFRDQGGRVAGGVKMANGTNPMRNPPFAATRGKAAALVREQFIRAQEYRQKLGAATRPDGSIDEAKAPARDLGLEALVNVLDKRWIVHHHTHRADDIMTVLRLSQEFDFRVVLHHVSEAAMVAQEIARAKVPCSIIVIDAPGGKLEAVNLSLSTGGVLERAGVNVAIHSDDWITDSRVFLRSGALAVRGGMSAPGALRALTLAGAEMMDLQSRVGSLEPGKDADFVLLSGDPFSVYTRVVETWVEGVKVFDLSNPVDRLHAEGGFGAGRDQQPYMCCAE